MPTLFEIGADYKALEELLLEGGAELDAEAALAFDRLFADFATDEAAKSESYYRLIRRFEMEAAAAKAEAEQYAMMARVRENAAGRLKDRMKAHLEFTGRKEAATASGKKFAIQANGGKQPVKFADGIDVESLPAEFVKVVKSIDADAVRAAIVAGEPVEFATLEPRGTHLRIR